MPALPILQSYLDEMSAATLAGDWDRYATAVDLPLILVTHATTMTVTTEAELRVGFDAFVAMLKSQRVTDYVRLVDSAVELDERLISGRYTSHFMAGSHRIIPPFRSSITLRLAGNSWRAASIANSLSNAQWPIHLPRVDVDLPPKGTEK